MAYYLDLFTRETWAAFLEHGGNVSGFRERQMRAAQRVSRGDVFLCYLVAVSRWCGFLEVESEVYLDERPIFSDPDPYKVRFRVGTRVSLELDRAIPIVTPSLWHRLSFTRGLQTPVRGWAQHANLRASLREIRLDDGKLLEDALSEQATEQREYPLTAYDQQKLRARASVRGLDRALVVHIPETIEDDIDQGEQVIDLAVDEVRASHRVQAKLANVGSEMGFRIWVPRPDRAALSQMLTTDATSALLDRLPLNYDDATLRTIENIDVLWLRGRSMSRAFEVEHTTAVYSGLLRMADLLALQPNMDIRLHIVAPDDKRDKVMREITRPVFSFLDRGPLSEACTYLSYSAVDELASTRHLAHMNDSILGEYEEFAEDT